MNDSPSGPPSDEGPLLPPNWDELAPLLDELLDLPPEHRPARVAELSAGVATRQRALEQLLAESERGVRLLDGLAAQRFNELANDPNDQTLPEVIGGRYRVGRELGRGGMATVYLARDEKHDRDVAIKVIKSDLSASLGHDRFLREIEIAARLRHANIVPLYDSGEVDGSLFFVMPYEEGQSLRERLRDTGALPIPDALGVLRDVARALAYAHEHGVVHRDVKPDNVMLSGGAALVTDFGIAKAVSVALTDAPDGTLTQAGTVIGTPAYMAPEQATGDDSIDHRADIYSFGCLGYELFAGHPPFQEQSTHLLIAAHLATVPRAIAELRPDVPATVAELLARCLAKAPADRPQSVRELLPILDGATGLSVSPPPTIQTFVAGRSSLTRMQVAGALLVAAAAIGGYFATRSTSAAAPITMAVLPFVNIAGDSAIDFVVDGLGEEVASALARVPGIIIKSRTGARAYRGQLAPDVTAAGVKLKADYLLSAVARQEGGRWILSIDFERAADATSLWDDRFLVSPNEQAAAVDSIAASLIAELRRQFPRVIGVPAALSANQRTKNNEAYRLYLRGQEKLNRRGQSVKDAVELFRQAIREDSLFAPAHSGLSMALALSPWFHRVRPAEVHDDILTAARSALALDPTLAQPHVALGMAHWEAYNWKGAETEFDTAVRLEPRNVEARVQYGRLLLGLGRLSEAFEQLRAARREDPASALVLSWTTTAYLLAGQVDTALVESRRALETDSTNFTTLGAAAQVYLATERLKDVHAVAVRMPDGHLHRGYYLVMSGDTAGGRELLRRLDVRPLGWGDQTQRAFTYLGLGDTTNALAALEHATDARELWPIYPSVTYPAFDPIRKSARFRVLLERVGLGEYIPALTR